MDAIAAFDGDVLALIGEWRGGTFGAYAPGMNPTGASFSPECQQYVEERFDLEETVALPNWPMFAASLRFWRRKK